MVGLLDLPPELRLIIYRLLLVDPVEQGQRITFALNPLNSSRTISDRAHCIRKDASDQTRHSAHICRVDAPTSTLHHFDFTDSMSLARTNKTLYAEDSPVIYSAIDLTLSLHRPLPGATSVSGITLLDRYLSRHRPTTLEMHDSLAINDKSAPMSYTDTNLIVNLVRPRLSKLRVFTYHIDGSLPASPKQHLLMLCQSADVVQAFARLQNGGVLVNLSSAISMDLSLKDTQIYAAACDMQERFVKTINGHIATIIRERGQLRKADESFRRSGIYLFTTLALRSAPDVHVQSNVPFASMEYLEEGLGIVHRMHDLLVMSRAMVKRERELCRFALRVFT